MARLRLTVTPDKQGGGWKIEGGGAAENYCTKDEAIPAGRRPRNLVSWWSRAETAGSRPSTARILGGGSDSRREEGQSQSSGEAPPSTPGSGVALATTDHPRSCSIRGRLRGGASGGSRVQGPSIEGNSIRVHAGRGQAGDQDPLPRGTVRFLESSGHA
jgi:Uncharacterized protein conserved in bacteria (DUF2188)